MVPPHRRASGGLEPAGRALEPAGRASEPAGRAPEPAFLVCGGTIGCFSLWGRCPKTGKQKPQQKLQKQHCRFDPRKKRGFFYFVMERFPLPLPPPSLPLLALHPFFLPFRYWEFDYLVNSALLLSIFDVSVFGLYLPCIALHCIALHCNG